MSTLDGKLVAAIAAAIETYEQQEQALSSRQSAQSKWLRQARREATQAGMTSFVRPGRWR